jgi:hypothetical protein
VIDEIGAQELVEDLEVILADRGDDGPIRG